MEHGRRTGWARDAWQGLARVIVARMAQMMGRASGGRGSWAWVVGVPWIRQGEGASGVPIERNLLYVYPNLEL